MVAVVAVVIAYYQYKVNKRLAEAQKAFVTTDLRISLFDEENIHSFIIAVPLKPNRWLEIPLIFSVENQGEKTAYDIQLSLRMNKALHYRGKAQLTFDSPLSGVRIGASSEGEYLQTIFFEIPYLNPDTKTIIVDRVSLNEPTLIDSRIDVPFRNKTIPVDLFVEYSFTIDCVISQRDIRPVGKRLSLQVHDISGTSIQEYFKAYNEEKNRHFLKTQAELSRWRRILRRLNPMETLGLEKIILIFIEENSIQADSRLPIDRVTEKSLRCCEALRDLRGVVIPTLDIY